MSRARLQSGIVTYFASRLKHTKLYTIYYIKYLHLNTYRSQTNVKYGNSCIALSVQECHKSKIFNYR